MTDSKKESVGLLAGFIYFVSSFLAAGTIADRIASTIVEWREVSNFEGAAGYAYALQIPAWFMFALVALWILFLFIRKQPIIVYFAIFIYIGISIPFLLLILDLIGIRS
ncbi:hypothetical protein [Leptospira stimsonii]|uniref:Uncharacterized protein n=1 Tax=Leptospira stimsonii TaxID=2202203 RepID=A0A396Z6R4_9LEPT|nr:hypothetical protein [Leptospira stimsonii]RHX89388.1 hypothetical protein DLM75_16300 [Leptospira stimsonii]